MDVRFSYDINGLLEVDVIFPDSGQRISKVINRSPLQLSQSQIEASRTRLEALKICPRDMLINRTFKAQLEEKWSRALSDERQWIGRIIIEFENALRENDAQAADKIRREACDTLHIVLHDNP